MRNGNQPVLDDLELLYQAPLLTQRLCWCQIARAQDPLWQCLRIRANRRGRMNRIRVFVASVATVVLAIGMLASPALAVNSACYYGNAISQTKAVYPYY